MFCRYERKKNIFLAIDAAKHLKIQLLADKKYLENKKHLKILMVIAGGYDVRVAENVEYLQVCNVFCYGSAVVLCDKVV